LENGLIGVCGTWVIASQSPCRSQVAMNRSLRLAGQVQIFGHLIVEGPLKTLEQLGLSSLGNQNTPLKCSKISARRSASSHPDIGVPKKFDLPINND